MTEWETLLTSQLACPTGNSSIVDTEFILSMLANNKTKANEKYMEYMGVKLPEIQQAETFEHLYTLSMSGLLESTTKSLTEMS
ncbi:hypothetical protein [Sporomusa termitida]|nr:hypothetical protein [Sporomusa termitida]